MKHSMRWIAAIIMILASLQLAACMRAPVAKEKIAPSKLEPVAGSDFQRVVLTQKAAERLDIQTVAVRAEPATRMWQVGGQVVLVSTKPSATISPAVDGAASAQEADLSRIWVRVNLSESELRMVDRGQPARVRPLGMDDAETGLEAEIDDAVDDGDNGEEGSRPPASASLLYAVDNKGDVLSPGEPVLVKLTATGNGAERKIVPFSALIYGVHGETWVYTTPENPEPLAFVRAPVTVDYIEDDLAFLSEGPPVGMKVVTVGGPLLYGAETGVSK